MREREGCFVLMKKEEEDLVSCVCVDCVLSVDFFFVVVVVALLV